jgi:hypothetical protein
MIDRQERYLFEVEVGGNRMLIRVLSLDLYKLM